MAESRYVLALNGAQDDSRAPVEAALIGDSEWTVPPDLTHMMYDSVCMTQSDRGYVRMARDLFAADCDLTHESPIEFS